MATNQNFTELDFERIKTNFRTFLEAQDQFKDYNFDGSNLSVFLDLLAYNDQYQSFYANMMFPERFLRHAVIRKHVVAGAKNLGYTPRSARSASAIVKLVLTPTFGYTSSIVIPAKTKFSGTNNDGTTFTFQTDDEIIVPNVAGVYQTNATIYDGKFYSFKNTISNNATGVTIPNKGVDTNRLRVFVRESISAVTRTEYIRSRDYTQVESDSTTYFIEEVEGELFRVYFGDDIIGKAIENGNVVEIEYFIASGVDANQINTFSIDDTIANTDFVAVSIVSNSSGGRDIEGKESVRTIAPTFHQAQNRAVTPQDYKALALYNFSNVEDAVAWGGEDNIPEDLGVVYLALKPVSGDILSQPEKDVIKAFFEANYSIIKVEPKLVDPAYIQAIIGTEVFYDSNQTNDGSVQILSDVYKSIQDFNTDNLDLFSKSLQYSRMVRSIDDSTSSAVNSNTEVALSFKIGDLTDLVVNDFTYYNELEPGSIKSSLFGYDTDELVFIKDDGIGNLFLHYFDTGADLRLPGDINVGSIDYATGDIVFDFDTFIVGDITLIADIDMYAKPQSNDIYVNKNRIVNIDDANIFVRVTDLQTAGSIVSSTFVAVAPVGPPSASPDDYNRWYIIMSYVG